MIKNSRVLVFVGRSRGYLGWRLVLDLKAVPSFADITDAKAVEADLDRVRPGVVVNCVGKTHGRFYNNVDGCQESPEARAETERSNVIGPEILALICKKRGIKLVHYSSGCQYLFTDDPMYRFKEYEAPSPVLMEKAWYVNTKVRGEWAIMDIYPGNSLIIRLRLPIDEDLNHPRNSIGKLTKHKEVIDVLNSGTIVKDLSSAVKSLLEKDAVGIFHVTNPDVISHSMVLLAYQEIIDPKYKIPPLIRSNDPAQALIDKGYALAPRSTCLLDTTKLNSLGIHLPKAMPQIREYMMAERDRIQRIAGL